MDIVYSLAWFGDDVVVFLRRLAHMIMMVVLMVLLLSASNRWDRLYDSFGDSDVLTCDRVQEAEKAAR